MGRGKKELKGLHRGNLSDETSENIPVLAEGCIKMRHRKVKAIKQLS